MVVDELCQDFWLLDLSNFRGLSGDIFFCFGTTCLLLYKNGNN